MADSWLSVMKQETERLNLEIEGLQGEIRLHNETKDAWDTILHNAGSDSFASYRVMANAEAQRLNSEIEAIQEKIQHHIQTSDAWEMVTHNMQRPPHTDQSVTYVKGEEVQWHLQRLDGEIEALQEEVRLHDETKEAWKTILRDTGSETQAICVELANSETARLDGEIETVQDKIRRHLETRSAWDTIVRNAGCESRIYQGAMYVRGWDGQWHRRQAESIEAHQEGHRSDTRDVFLTVNSVRQALLNVCERTLRIQRNRIALPVRSKEQFQSLGLR
jgi:hypothetical protein